MKQKIFVLSAIAALLLLATGCANDDSTQENGKEDNGKSGEVVATFESEDSTAETPSSTTRTSLTHQQGRGATAYWTPRDHIFAQDDNGNYRLSHDATRKDGSAIKGDKSSADRDARFKFMNGTYTKPDRKIRYTGCGNNGTTAYNVTIYNRQTQDKPNDADHIGRDGDCGVAVSKGRNGGYKFKLEHKASYLCFMPRIEDSKLAANVYLTKIVVTSNNKIAGTYEFDDNGLKGTGQYNSITLHTKGTGSVPGPWNPSANSQRYINCPGFPISSNKLDISQSAYMVIAPGTHKLTIDYTIEDPATEIEGTIRKYVNLTCDPGKIYDITANLTPREFYPYYYMWGSWQHYWEKHYDWQTFLNTQTRDPQIHRDDDRAFSLTKANYTDPRSYVMHMPNINELCWYVWKGDPHWDGDYLWRMRGHLYKGGMWFLKKQHITGFNKEKAYNGVDYRNKYKSWVDSIPQLKEFGYDKETCWIENEEAWKLRTFAKTPPQNTSNYFFLPAVGYYHTDHEEEQSQQGKKTRFIYRFVRTTNSIFKLRHPEYYGVYWSSSVISTNEHANHWIKAFCLHFSHDCVGIENDFPTFGYSSNNDWFK